MRKVIIDGNKIETLEDFHQEIKMLLELPDYYGKNLDALWDCLTGWVETPLTIIWNNFEESRNNLGGDAHKIVEVFTDAEKESDGFEVEYN